MSFYTDKRPDLSHELPNWMFDESYCSGMTLGPPEISIAGLDELAATLASLGATQAQNPLLRERRRRMMRNRRPQNRDQLVLQLECQNLQVPVVKNVEGLVEAPADLSQRSVALRKMNYESNATMKVIVASLGVFLIAVWGAVGYGIYSMF